MRQIDRCIFCDKEARFSIGSKVIGKTIICYECIVDLKDIFDVIDED